MELTVDSQFATTGRVIAAGSLREFVDPILVIFVTRTNKYWGTLVEVQGYCKEENKWQTLKEYGKTGYQCYRTKKNKYP